MARRTQNNTNSGVPFLFGVDALEARKRKQEEEDAKLHAELDDEGVASRNTEDISPLGPEKPLFNELFYLLGQGDLLVLDLRTPKEKEAAAKLARDHRPGASGAKPPQGPGPKVWFFHPRCPGIHSTRKDLLLFARQHRVVTVGLPSPPDEAHPNPRFDHLHQEYPRLAEPDEWPAYIQAANKDWRECDCPLKDFVRQSSGSGSTMPRFALPLPHPYFYLYDTARLTERDFRLHYEPLKKVV